MGIATYVRSETLVLAGFIYLTVLFHHRNRKSFLKNILKDAISFLLPSLVAYILSITIYINCYLPSVYELDTLVNKKLLDLTPFYQRLSEMTGQLLLAGNTITYYGYFVFIFAIILTANTFYKNAWNKNSLNWLFAVFIIYLGLPFMGYLFPLYDLDNSTKRGLLKIFPLMLFFMANSQILTDISERIRKWEENQ
jgi:hypothetical protein